MPFEQRMEEGLPVPLARIALRPPVAALGGHAGEPSVTHNVCLAFAPKARAQSNAIRGGKQPTIFLQRASCSFALTGRSISCWRLLSVRGLGAYVVPEATWVGSRTGCLAVLRFFVGCFSKVVMSLLPTSRTSVAGRK